MCLKQLRLTFESLSELTNAAFNSRGAGVLSEHSGDWESGAVSFPGQRQPASSHLPHYPLNHRGIPITCF